MARKTSNKVIDVLNEVLTSELTSINQYFLHAEMCRDWGFLGLGSKIRAESIEEMRHAEWLIERVLFLKGIPNVQRLQKINIGETVKEIFESDLALEHEAIVRLNDGIELCRTEGDNGSRDLLTTVLKSEEEHADWIESQLEVIRQVGEQNYLSTQIHGAAV